MSAVIFENNGRIDLRAIRTFGVSAKEKADAIGYFGTGLKYAIAILVREGCEVEMFTGGLRHTFSKAQVQMRGQEFEAVCMNGEELPFTTRLGINWKLWQAFRELYCNCLDENGRVYAKKEFAVIDQEKTYFVVRGKAFLEEYAKRHEIVLDLPESLKIGDGQIEVYNKPSAHIYYRGIRVWDMPRKTLFTYNIMEDTVLTEDRTLKDVSHVFGRLPLAICRMSDKKHIEAALTADETYEEREFSFYHLNYSNDATPEFNEVLQSLFKDNHDRLNKSAREIQRKLMNAQASKHYEEETLSQVQQKMLDKAVNAIHQAWPEFKAYKVLVVKTLGQETMGLADMLDKSAVISVRCFELGTKYLTSTILEEFIHLKTGYYDHSRQLQTYLFDQLLTLVENHVIKEPL